MLSGSAPLGLSWREPLAWGHAPCWWPTSSGWWTKDIKVWPFYLVKSPLKAYRIFRTPHRISSGFIWDWITIGLLSLPHWLPSLPLQHANLHLRVGSSENVMFYIFYIFPDLTFQPFVSKPDMFFHSYLFLNFPQESPGKWSIWANNQERDTSIRENRQSSVWELEIEPWEVISARRQKSIH